MPVVYVVEDEKDLASLVERYLINEQYTVKVFGSGEEALPSVGDNVDLWVLDIMLPGSINGYDLLRKIREIKPSMPVIYTSARDQDIDRVLGLELGSDDYIAKPYSLRELMLRIRNILSRKNSMDAKVTKIGPYVVDIEAHRVSSNGEEIILTSKEFDLLSLLLQNPGQAFSREQILESVWGKEYFGSDRVVDDLMRRLRQKMPKLRVETVYGFGYRMI